MNVEECVAKGLLKKTAPDVQKAGRSLETAEHKLDVAGQEFDAEIYENAVISAYTSMFHAARSLLYRDGFKERSHYAISIFIAERYGDKIEKRFVNELDTLRMERHEIMYGIEERKEIREIEAESAIGIAREFLEAVRKLVKA